MKKYDVVMLGSGVGGSTAAHVLKNGGKKVAVIEEELWGGTCPNRGCDPKKVLISGLEVVERNNQLVGKGFAPIHSIRWQELMAFKRTFTEPFPKKFQENTQKQGIDTIKGSAKFLNPKQIQVGEEIIEADVFVIATGQRASILDIEGKEHLKTSVDFLELEKLPEKLTFIGAGYIAFEFAAIANAAGSDVTIIHNQSRPLANFDEDLVSDMVGAFQKKGIKFIFNVDIQKVTKEGGEFLLTGAHFSQKTDYIVCSAGRIPNVEQLSLEKAKVEYNKHGIAVNQYLQTSNPAIFACGDVVAKKQPKLTPVATFEGKYIAKKILDDSLEAIAYPPIASIVYGSPKLAEVGVGLNAAKEESYKYTIHEVDLTNWFTYRRINEAIAKAKLVYEGNTLVGAGVLNSQADELINFLAIIIGKEITSGEVKRMILGYPTIASDLHYLI